MPSNMNFFLHLPTFLLFALFIYQQVYFVTANDDSDLNIEEESFGAANDPFLSDDPSPDPILTDPMIDEQATPTTPVLATEPNLGADASPSSISVATTTSSPSMPKASLSNSTDSSFVPDPIQLADQVKVDLSNATDLSGQSLLSMKGNENTNPPVEESVTNKVAVTDTVSNPMVGTYIGTGLGGPIQTEEPMSIGSGGDTQPNLNATNQINKAIGMNNMNGTHVSALSSPDTSTLKATTSNTTLNENGTGSDRKTSSPDNVNITENNTGSSQPKSVQEGIESIGTNQVKTLTLNPDGQNENGTSKSITNPSNGSVNEALVKTLLKQLEIIHREVNGLVGALDEEDSLTEETGDDQNCETLSEELDELMDGVTKRFRDLRHLLHSMGAEDERLEFEFDHKINASLYRHVLIGTRNRLNKILNVMLSFYDDKGRVITDDEDGRPIRYESSRHRLGHIIDILHQGFFYHRAKLSIKLKPNSQLNADDLIFHFARATGIYMNIPSARISGPNEVFIDSSPQNFSESVICHSDAGCRWKLDDDIVANVSDRSVLLVFREHQMGNRILAYVRQTPTQNITLASIRLSILSNPNIKCSPLPRTPRNEWLEFGEMITPRADFTMTYLPQSQLILIVGGTADGSTPLASYEYFNVSTGCFTQLNMTYARMKHTATYLNESDFVIIIGGQGSDLQPMAQTEFIWPSGNQAYKNITVPRYLHVTSPPMNSTIYIVGGRGPTDSSNVIEVFYWQDEPSAAAAAPEIRRKRLASLPFGPNDMRLLNNIVGHSVTYFGLPPFVLLFGGRNHNTILPIAHVFDGQYITLVFRVPVPPDILPNLAYHQTLYLPEVNSVFITGGDNGSHVSQNSYLIRRDDALLNMSGPMSVMRSYHAAVKLTNGSVLVIGGTSVVESKQSRKPLDSVERYDPSIGQFTKTNPLKIPRYGHIAVHFPDNTILVCGGRGIGDQILKSCEILMY